MVNTRNVTLGKKLKLLRTTTDAIQDVIAAKLNIGQQAYSKLENGKTKFTDKKIYKICDVFNITPEYFITLENSLLLPITVRQQIMDHDSYKILMITHKKQLLEKDIHIVELELAARKPKKHKVVYSKLKPIYVMI